MIKNFKYFLPAILPIILIIMSLGWGVPNNWRLKYFGENNGKLINLSAKDTNEMLDKKDSLRIARAEEINWTDIKKTRALRRGLIFSENPDEMLVLSAIAAMKPHELNFSPKDYTYGWLYNIACAVAIKSADIFGLIKLKPNIIFYLNNPSEFGNLYIAGRSINIFFVMILYWGAFKSAKLFGAENFSAAVLATTICSLPGIISWSIIMKPHLAAATINFLAFAFSIDYYKTQKNSAMLASLFFSGLAISLLYSSLLIILIPLSLTIYTYKMKNRIERTLSIIPIVLKIFVLLSILFLLFNPYLMFNLSTALKDIKHNSSMHPFQPFSLLFIPSGFLHLNLLFGVGGLLALIASLIKFLCGKSSYQLKLPKKIIIFWAISFCFIIWFIASHTTSRFFTANDARLYLIMTPLLFFILIKPILNNKKLLTVACVLTLLNSLYISLAHHSATPTCQATQEAAEYIQKNISENSTISFNGSYAPYRFPPLDFNRYRLTTIEGNLSSKGYILTTFKNPEYGVLMKTFKSKMPYFHLSFVDHEIYLYKKE